MKIPFLKKFPEKTKDIYLFIISNKLNLIKFFYFINSKMIDRNQYIPECNVVSPSKYETKRKNIKKLFQTNQQNNPIKMIYSIKITKSPTYNKYKLSHKLN